MDRRHFLLHSGASPLLVPLLAPQGAGEPQQTERSPKVDSAENPPAPRKRIGAIGTGGRWQALAAGLMHFGDLVALCDVDSIHLENARQIVLKNQANAPELYRDYTALLAREDLDVVVIATPDHWHAKMSIEAMRAGKDVYCEKPLTLSIEEGNAIIRVVEQTGRTLQVGTQQRSQYDLRFLTAVALCRDGRLGKITKVTVGLPGAPHCDSLPELPPPPHLDWDRWLGPAPWAPYRCAPDSAPADSAESVNSATRPATRGHYHFRWWYESSGGNMTNWGAHHVDIAHWGLGKSDTSPLRITPRHVSHPVPLDGQGNPTDPSRYNTATEFLVECEFADGVLLEISSSAPQGVQFMGDQGELFVSRSEFRGTAVDALADKPLDAELLRKTAKGTLPHGPHAHLRDFFAAAAARRQGISDVYSHHRAMTTCHLANLALRLGRELRFDPESQQIIGDPEALAMQRRTPRDPYSFDA